MRYIILLLLIGFKGYSITYHLLPLDTSKKDTTKESRKYSKFKIELDYYSNNTFNGRRDTTGTSTLSPLFKYTTKSKFFFTTTFVHAPGGKSTFDEMDLGLGKKFTFSDKWDGTISYTHYFFDSNVARIKAAVQNDLFSYIGYDWDILYSQLKFDYSGGNEKFKYKGKKVAQQTRDVTFRFANSHDFSYDDVFKTDDDLSIMPELDILYGTQNFLATYKGKADKANKANKVYQDQVSKFAITGYVFYLNMFYSIKKFTFALTPYYTIPTNVPTGESSAPYFVMGASVYYTFKIKN